MAEPVTIYVTKDAERSGIRRFTGESTGGGYWRNAVGIEHFSPSQVHTDLTSAITDAERRRSRKIAAPEKQIAALRAIDLTVAKEG